MGDEFTPDQCHAKAAQCYRLSQKTIDTETRTQLLDLMAQWRELAGRIERLNRK
jgi:hypothetical protein